MFKNSLLTRDYTSQNYIIKHIRTIQLHTNKGTETTNNHRYTCTCVHVYPVSENQNTHALLGVALELPPSGGTTIHTYTQTLWTGTWSEPLKERNAAPCLLASTPDIAHYRWLKAKFTPPRVGVCMGEGA